MMEIIYLYLDNSDKCMFSGVLKRRLQMMSHSCLQCPITMPGDVTGNERVSVEVFFKP